MSNRLISVTGYTTLDYVDAVAKGETFEWESVAVVNATTDREAPDRVRLQVELDNATEEHLPKHTAELELTSGQARTLAADLETYAEQVEDGDTDAEETGRGS
ncbi:DUF6360 family protein [Halopiger aswanensis]|uniref:Uncharacterized protein n=1 Tax=Halopiger aswanensis TaxID=148449 RepID=A0A3R7HJH9_9EURY|nr:DUF6360 family protein [Halopiger aswanensis]RKD95997.1 hypothetical protein ATJ93_2860 [Halopiger aswanensis]